MYVIMADALFIGRYRRHKFMIISYIDIGFNQWLLFECILFGLCCVVDSPDNQLALLELSYYVLLYKKMVKYCCFKTKCIFVDSLTESLTQTAITPTFLCCRFSRF